MKAWVVKDYKEVHMSNSLIALAHSKPDYECLCTEVNILTDEQLQERDERIRRDHEILVETMLTTFKAEKELIAREAFEAVKKLCYEIPHEEADRLLPAQSIAGDWAAETAIGIYTKIDKITFEDYKKSKGDKV